MLDPSDRRQVEVLSAAVVRGDIRTETDWGLGPKGQRDETQKRNVRWARMQSDACESDPYGRFAVQLFAAVKSPMRWCIAGQGE
jgi:hypothetical protein